jgi:hypothetical protein
MPLLLLEASPLPLELPLELLEASPPLELLEASPPLELLESALASPPLDEDEAPEDEELEQPAPPTLMPAPATIKRTTLKASFFIASPISP